MLKWFLFVAHRLEKVTEQLLEYGPVRNFQIVLSGPLRFCLHFCKIMALLAKSSNSDHQALTVIRLEVSHIFIYISLCVRHKVSSVITGGFTDQLSLHISLCHGKGGTLQLKDSIRELKWKGSINTSLETPAPLMYIQEHRKKTNPLKICQKAFNHGAVGHFASGERRSKISSGAMSLESLWSSALLEFNLLCHRVRLHSGGQMKFFFFFYHLCFVEESERLSIFVVENACALISHQCKNQGLFSSFQKKPFVSL